MSPLPLPRKEPTRPRAARGPPRRPPELPLVQRQVCGEDYNDGALLRLFTAPRAKPFGDLASYMAARR